TPTGGQLGTLSYMAPEQATARPGIDWRLVDVYGLGAILYETLTGRPPFRGATETETLRQLLDLDPVPPRRLQPAIARDLETICLKCLRREPAKRYASALELADDLRRFQEGRPIQARPTPPWERGWRWCRRNRWKAAFSGLVATVLVLLVLY